MSGPERSPPDEPEALEPAALEPAALEPAALEPASRIFAELLEGYHAGEGSPEARFADYPQHAPAFRRWWQQMRATGEIPAESAATGQ